MAKNFLLCIGGTGAKVGEAFTHLAATGFLGEGETEIWLIDKDEQCANGNFLETAVKNYQNAKKCCCWEKAKCFNHTLTFQRWSFSPALNELDGAQTNGSCSFASLKNKDASGAVETVMNFLHDVSSQESSMDGGFYGRAQTGTALFNAMTKTKRFKDGNTLYDAIESSIQSGETRVFLAGSSFGATGASMLPNMAENIRNEFKSKKGAKSLYIGAVLMLPYFKYERPEAGVTQRVASETHWEKAAEALKYYSSSVTIRRENQSLGQEETVFDGFYIVGINPLVSVNRSFADKGLEQNNDPHIAELFAAMAVKNFYDLKQKATSNLPAVYAYSLGAASSELDWTRIHEELKVPMLDFTRFCVSILTLVHPLTCQRNLTEDDTVQKWFGVDTGWWGKVTAVHVDEETLVSNVKQVADYTKDFFTYIQTICNIGPAVALFDEIYINDVCSALLNYSPNANTMDTLRDAGLATEYSQTQIRELRALDKPQKIVARVDRSSVQSSRAMNVLEDTLSAMRTFAKESVPNTPDAKKTHTNDGLQKLYQFLYTNYGVQSWNG